MLDYASEMESVSPDLDSSCCAAALLRDALVTWEEETLPYFQDKAKSHWGDKWQDRCASLLDSLMRTKIFEGSGWDCYKMAIVFVKRPDIFFPNYDICADCERELYRY